MKAIQTMQFENMTFAYDQTKTIFANASIQFPMDSYVILKSDSTGAGSSTLFQILAGVLMASQGDYKINGVSLRDMSFEDFLPYRLNIGFSFDQGGLLHNRTVLENLTLPLLYHKIFSYEETKNYAIGLLAKMNIDKYANLRPSVVQGSVRKATVLLRALVMNPQVLFLDDPTHGLSPDSAQKFFSVVQEKKDQGKLQTVFLNSKDQGIIEQVKKNHSSKTLVIRENKIYED